MEYSINLPENLNNIQNFKTLLERYKDYKSCIRDIKINNILGKKTLLDIDEIHPPIICGFDENLISIARAPLTIEKMYFKLDYNLNILEFKIKYSILRNESGKLIYDLQSSGYKFEIKPKVILDDINPQVVGFYLSTDANLISA